MKHIIYLFRKPRTGAFSIEKLFRNVQNQFPEELDYTNYFLSRHSVGLTDRLFLIWETFRNRGEINHITGDVNFVGLLLPKHKTVLTIHDLESLKRNNSFINSILMLFWLKIPVSRAQFVTVVSETTKEKLLAALPVSPDKIVVIPNMISPLFEFKPKTFNNDEPVLLQVGTKYNKNLERTIEALAGIKCTYVIVGQLSSNQVELLKKYKVNYANYEGITDDMLRDLYIQADVVTFVSLFEGFGMPILEAQATGRVVVTSNCSSMPEVAGKGAYFVDPDSTESIRQGILRVINDGKFREELITNGLINFKRFSPKTIAQMYLDLYAKL